MHKNLAKQNKESEPPKTDPPPTEPPKTEPPKTEPQEETSYFRTGVNVLSTIGIRSFFILTSPLVLIQGRP